MTIRLMLVYLALAFASWFEHVGCDEQQRLASEAYVEWVIEHGGLPLNTSDGFDPTSGQNGTCS